MDEIHQKNPNIKIGRKKRKNFLDKRNLFIPAVKTIKTINTPKRNSANFTRKSFESLSFKRRFGILRIILKLVNYFRNLKIFKKKLIKSIAKKPLQIIVRSNLEYISESVDDVLIWF